MSRTMATTFADTFPGELTQQELTDLEEAHWDREERRIEQESPWALIADAPGDGTPVDLWLEFGHTAATIIRGARWDAAKDEWLVDRDGETANAVPLFAFASHWSPEGAGDVVRHPVPSKDRYDFDAAFCDTWPTAMLERAQAGLRADKELDETDRIILGNVEAALATR